MLDEHTTLKRILKDIDKARLWGLGHSLGARYEDRQLPLPERRGSCQLGGERLTSARVGSLQGRCAYLGPPSTALAPPLCR